MPTLSLGKESQTNKIVIKSAGWIWCHLHRSSELGNCQTPLAIKVCKHVQSMRYAIFDFTFTMETSNRQCNDNGGLKLSKAPLGERKRAWVGLHIKHFKALKKGLIGNCSWEKIKGWGFVERGTGWFLKSVFKSYTL